MILEEADEAQPQIVQANQVHPKTKYNTHQAWNKMKEISSMLENERIKRLDVTKADLKAESDLDVISEVTSGYRSSNSEQDIRGHSSDSFSEVNDIVDEVIDNSIVKAIKRSDDNHARFSQEITRKRSILKTMRKDRSKIVFNSVESMSPTCEDLPDLEDINYNAGCTHLGNIEARKYVNQSACRRISFVNSDGMLLAESGSGSDTISSKTVKNVGISATNTNEEVFLKIKQISDSLRSGTIVGNGTFWISLTLFPKSGC